MPETRAGACCGAIRPPPIRHGRARPGHPRVFAVATKNVDARIPGTSPGKCGHDEVRDGGAGKRAPPHGAASDAPTNSFVMAGLVPAIHEFFVPQEQRTWMPATRAGMTNYGAGVGENALRRMARRATSPPTYCRHGRAHPGHPRVFRTAGTKNVDARNKCGHDGVRSGGAGGRCLRRGPEHAATQFAPHLFVMAGLVPAIHEFLP